MINALKIHPIDNVAVVVIEISKADILTYFEPNVTQRSITSS